MPYLAQSPPALQAAVDADPARFHVASSKGCFGAEECLRLLVAQQLGGSGGAGGGALPAAAGEDAACTIA